MMIEGQNTTGGNVWALAHMQARQIKKITDESVKREQKKMLLETIKRALVARNG
jgi:phage gp16-like protein